MTKLTDFGGLAVEGAIKAGADEAEAFVAQGKEISVKAEANELKLATSHARDGLGVRVFTKKGLGFASVNTLEERQIGEAVQAATSLSKASPQDEHNALPDPQPVRRIDGLHDESARGIGVDQAISILEEMLTTARGYDPRVTIDSASFNVEVGRQAVVNSKGVRTEEETSTLSCFIMGMARDNEEVSSFNYRFDSTRSVTQMDARGRALEFARNVVASLGAKKGESFVGPIILSPDAVLEMMLLPIVWAISAKNVQTGMSRWAGMLGKSVSAPLLSIEDDGQLAGGACSASFDREGLPHERLTVINEGILQTYLYNSYTARKDNRSSTGHASGGTRSVPAIGPTNLFIRPGQTSKEDLVSGVKRGVLITRFSSAPRPVSGDISGVVKGGFLIENGRIARPLIETMISGNLFEMLPRISGLSQETESLAYPGEVALVSPYIRIDDVTVTAG